YRLLYLAASLDNTHAHCAPDDGGSMIRKRRFFIPLLLCAIGVWLLTGCLYIPMFGKVREGTNAAKQVGEAHSRKPLRRFVATREDVERVLGRAPYQTSDGKVLAY